MVKRPNLGKPKLDYVDGNITVKYSKSQEKPQEDESPIYWAGNSPIGLKVKKRFISPRSSLSPDDKKKKNCQEKKEPIDYGQLLNAFQTMFNSNQDTDNEDSINVNDKDEDNCSNNTENDPENFDHSINLSRLNFVDDYHDIMNQVDCDNKNESNENDSISQLNCTRITESINRNANEQMSGFDPKSQIQNNNIESTNLSNLNGDKKQIHKRNEIQEKDEFDFEDDDFELLTLSNDLLSQIHSNKNIQLPQNQSAKEKNLDKVIHSQNNQTNRKSQDTSKDSFEFSDDDDQQLISSLPAQKDYDFDDDDDNGFDDDDDGFDKMVSSMTNHQLLTEQIVPVENQQKYSKNTTSNNEHENEFEFSDDENFDELIDKLSNDNKHCQNESLNKSFSSGQLSMSQVIQFINE